jgi:hypothetical protein
MRAPIAIAALSLLASLGASAAWSPAYADCICRAPGRVFQLGERACLRTPQGSRLAICGMVLNNTSWLFSDVPCPVTSGTGEPARMATRN